MLDQLTYQTFCGWVSGHTTLKDDDVYRFQVMIPKINEFIKESEVKMFYPKNLFVDEREIELLFFTDKRVFRITGDRTRVFFENFSLDDVIDYNFEVSQRNNVENVKLNIFFTLDRHLVLDSSVDINMEHVGTMNEKIKNIYRELLNTH